MRTIQDKDRLLSSNISLQSSDRPLKFKLTWFFSPGSMQKFISLKVVKIFLCVILMTVGFFGQSLPVSANTSPPTLMASVLSFSGKRPSNLGVKNGKLASCPASPNCVSSQSSDAEHKIEPLSYEGTPEEAIAALKAILDNIENAETIAAAENYIYAEFTSKLMGFVDDVEFYLDEEPGVIQVRSASRLGESDLGVNRKRIEAIRAQFNG